MIRLVRAEFLKLRTTQVWFWLLLASVAITALIVVGQISGMRADDPSTSVTDVFVASHTAFIAVFVLGVLGVTTEFRYQTITPTVLGTPSRWAIVTAKMITYALVGAVYALACVAVEVAMALPWLSAKGFDVSFSGDHVGRALLAVFGVVTLYGLVGLGAGALLRNQIVAVSVGVIFLLILQNIVVAIPGVKHVFPYLPGGATNAIVVITGDRTVNGVTLLSAPAGVLVLVLWAVVPAVLGAAITMTRDIT